MKRILVLAITTFLLISIVYAAENQKANMKPEHSTVAGLENAILMVRNNETSASLQDVLLKIENKRIEQLAKLENLTFENEEKTNKIIAEGKGKAKFLGIISVDRIYRYGIDSEGIVTKKPRLFDFLFKKENPVTTT